MNWTGLIAAIGTFLLIGSFHVIVIKTEYYFGKQVWPVFAGVGIFSLLASLLISNMIISVLIAVFGITCIWSIKELFEQEERVKKGWFPDVYIYATSTQSVQKEKVPAEKPQAFFRLSYRGPGCDFIICILT